MGFLWASLAKDLARWRQDRTSFVIWLGIPFLIGGLMTVLLGGDDLRPRGVLLVADLDESLPSAVVIGAFGQGELGDMIVVETVSVAEGNARIDAGDASAFLTIPDGFGVALFEATPVTLTLTTNPSQTILPAIITDVTEILLDAGFYLHELFASEFEMIRNVEASDMPDEVAVATIAVAVQRKLDLAAPHLLPPAIDLDIVAPPPERPSVNVALLFLPGIILMAVMFAASGLAGDYWLERERGALRRLVAAPGRLAAYLGGKALAAGSVIGLIGLLTLVVGFLYHGLAWHRLPLAALWVAVSGVALFAWFGALQMLAGSRRAANLVSLLLLFPLLMAGGSFFPLAALPDGIARIGRHTPNGFMADRLTALVTAADGELLAASSWLVVVLMAVAGLALSGWRLKRSFARG